MTTLREAAQQALEAMESAEVDPHSSDAIYKAITALKAALVEDAMQKFTDVNQELEAALAEPVQEPVAWKDKTYESLHHQDFGNSIPLYTAPPQRKPLTEEEIYSLFRTVASPVMFARAIERAHHIT